MSADAGSRVSDGWHDSVAGSAKADRDRSRPTAAITFNVAVLAPTELGLNATSTSQLPPTPSNAPQLLVWESVKWSHSAADQGDTVGQFNLGNMYRDGRGVPQSDVDAYKWFSLAASRTSNAELRDRATKNRDNVSAKMNPANIAQAKKRAREWAAAFEKHRQSP